MDFTDINNIINIFCTSLVSVTILTLIYFRCKYFIEKKWIYSNILFNILLLYFVYQFPYIFVQLPIIAALIALYIITLTISREFIEISVSNDIITKYISCDLEYNGYLPNDANV